MEGRKEGWKNKEGGREKEKERKREKERKHPILKEPDLLGPRSTHHTKISFDGRIKSKRILQKRIGLGKPIGTWKQIIQ